MYTENQARNASFMMRMFSLKLIIFNASEEYESKCKA